MKIFIIIFLLSIVARIKGFIKLPLGSPLSIKNKEIKRKITLNLPPEDLEIVNGINGFYGLIGPDLNIDDIENLYHLLLGDGIIQGVFFNKGELTFTKKYVKTEKIVYEQECGKVLQNNWIHLLFFIFNKLNLLPNIFGLANTAMIDIKGKYYALYERDLPYEILLDKNKGEILTGNKKCIKGLKHFSAHSKINKIENLAETIDYNILTNSVDFHQLDSDLVLQKTITASTKYLPIIHDFVSTRYNYIILDSPLHVKLFEIMQKTMPVTLSQDKPTYIHIVNKNTGRVRTYESLQSFYLFHYADIQEDETYIRIYAAMYDKIDFSTLDIQGRYRCLVIDKYLNKVTIEKRMELENLDMDFPVWFENKVILRNMKDRVCDGFVVCQNLEIIHKIFLKDKFVCGEPSIIVIKNMPYLITFVFNMNKENSGSILLINLRNYKEIEIPLAVPIKYGFHSFFTNI
jgi:carotenoid cleavage dioxygenase-like enzyme